MTDPQQYGAMPPPPQNAPMQQGPPPPPVVTAVRLMFVNAGLSVIGLIILLTTKGSLRTAVRDRNKSVSDKRIDELVNTAVTVGIVIGVILLVLYVLLALQVRKGKNWARIVTWVFAGLGLLSGVASLAQPGSALTKVFSAIGALIDLGIIVLLAQSASRPYFRKPQY
jgi:hypothetical protein